MRLITDNLLKAVAIVAVIVVLFFYKMAAGFAVDPSFVSVTATQGPAAAGGSSGSAGGGGANKAQALSAWTGAHSWGWGRGTPKRGFGADEIVLELRYPNGNLAKMTVQKETICVKDQNGLVWRLLTPQEYNELNAMFAE
jgi:hypothetical protein